MPKPAATFIAPTAILSSIGGIAMDCAVSMTHVFDYEITDDPIETGEDMTDNVYRKPIKIDVQGIITDTPFLLMRGLKINPRDRMPGDSPVSLKRLPYAGRSIEGFDKLRTLADRKLPFTVVTGIYVYRNMMFQSLSAPTSSADGFSLKFSASMREVQFNDNVGTQASLERIDQNRQVIAASLVNLGVRAAIQVSNALAPRIVPQLI